MGPLSRRDFVSFFQNSIFRKFVSISSVISPETQNFFNFIMDRAKIAFSRIGPKMSMKRVPIEIFGGRNFFIESLSKKKIRGRGPQKSTISGLFSKIDVRNFCQLGKNVFFELPIFLKNRGNGGLFLGVRPKMFFANLY